MTEAMMNNSLIAWHYTLGDRAAGYRQAGFIPGEVKASQRPFVWFSTRQDWEPMAYRDRVMDDGTQRDATLEEMAAGMGGLWRFGVPASTLLPWGRLRDAARIRPKAQRALVSAAAGADPYSWYGSIKPVRVELCVIQCRMTAADEWGEPAPGLPTIAAASELAHSL